MMAGQKRPSQPPVGVDSLLASDLFRFTRSNQELARLERDARSSRSRPYLYLLNALLGVGDRVTERTAKATWARIRTHRNEVSQAIGRPLPLRAAAIDWLYLRDGPERPFRPIVVSESTLAAALEEGRTDSVSGLPRRAHFERALARELRRQPFIGGSVVFIDLDGFKRANDDFGHARGDLTLRRFAQAVRGALRKEDLVGRMGGDEFALLLSAVPVSKARLVAERLRARFESECSAEGVSFSFGVTGTKAGESIETVLRRVDREMYRQKRARRRRTKR